MARMHSRKKGKSGSTKPGKKGLPTWVRYKPKEVEMLIVKLAKEGKTPSEIGIYMRDTYGIPDVKTITKKKITKILEEKKLVGDIPEDLMSLIKKAVLVKKHLEANNQDTTAIRGMQLTESKIKRLVTYYKQAKKLPLDWKYDIDKVRLFIE